MPRSSASRRTATASGCSLCASKAAATQRSSSSPTPAAGMRSVTRGLPSVIVPVLSSTTKSAFPVASKAAAVLKRMPFFAPLPLPTMMATGVASPRAHGQLMTSTLTARARAKLAVSPRSSQKAPVARAKTMTTGTNTPDTLSASFEISAFEAAAFCTISMICCSVVSSPTRRASQVKAPF